LLELRIFDACKNAAALMIAMLGCSEINIEVSDTSVEIAESDNCREMSRDNRDVNSVLAAI